MNNHHQIEAWYHTHIDSVEKEQTFWAAGFFLDQDGFIFSCKITHIVPTPFQERKLRHSSKLDSAESVQIEKISE